MGKGINEGDIVNAIWNSHHEGESIVEYAIVLHAACATGDLTVIMDMCGVKHCINQSASAFEGFVIKEAHDET